MGVYTIGDDGKAFDASSWASSSSSSAFDPWVLPLVDADIEYETRVGVWALVYTIVNLVSYWFFARSHRHETSEKKKKEKKTEISTVKINTKQQQQQQQQQQQKVRQEQQQRPDGHTTTQQKKSKTRLLLLNLASSVASTIHALAVASGCLYVVLEYRRDCGDSTPELIARCPRLEDAAETYHTYHHIVCMSLGYFVSDAILYCLAARDIPMLVHHTIMICAYYPTASITVGLHVFPSGSIHFWVYVGAAAYICEFATVLLNARMFAVKLYLRENVWW